MNIKKILHAESVDRASISPTVWVLLFLLLAAGYLSEHKVHRFEKQAQRKEIKRQLWETERELDVLLGDNEELYKAYERVQANVNMRHAAWTTIDKQLGEPPVELDEAVIERDSLGAHKKKIDSHAASLKKRIADLKKSLEH